MMQGANGEKWIQCTRFYQWIEQTKHGEWITAEWPKGLRECGGLVKKPHIPEKQ